MSHTDAYRVALERARREMLVRFSPLNRRTVPAAVQWQEARIRELLLLNQSSKTIVR